VMKVSYAKDVFGPMLGMWREQRQVFWRLRMALRYCRSTTAPMGVAQYPA
jgi:hypothetical protein